MSDYILSDEESEAYDGDDESNDDDESDSITYWHYRKKAAVHFGILDYKLFEFYDLLQTMVKMVDETLDYLLNNKTANWQKLCNDLIRAHCHTHNDRNESGHATAGDTRKKKQNINNQFLESLTMASKGKTYFRMKELMSNEKAEPVADLFYDIAMNQTNVSEMVRNHKKREKYVENRKYDYLF